MHAVVLFTIPDVVQLTMPITLKRTASIPSFCNSSDTEPMETPPRKRTRLNHDYSPGSTSSSMTLRTSSSASPTSRSRRKPARESDFELRDILRRCAATPASHAAIKDIKAFPKGESAALYAVQRLVQAVKADVKSRVDRREGKLLETELYLEWLKEFKFVITGIENSLTAKMPGTRKRVTGLGRISFTILYHLIDEFISEVESHHDGWSYRSSSREPSIYPATMTIIEESHEPTADARCREAVHLAEELLRRYDEVMVDAVRRYRVECGRNNCNLASAIGTKEHSLARACCLLCEQTGYGGDEDDMGDTLLRDSRNLMREWKKEFEDELADDSECGSSP